MAVYVDDGEYRFGRMIMCHMAADSTRELLVMADRLGLKRAWIQDAGTAREHFDVSQTKRRQAIAHGAIEVNAKTFWRERLRRGNAS